MENAPPQLVYFHGKKLENQVLLDISGRKTVRKDAGELANRKIFRPTNLSDWLILQVTDSWFNFFSTQIRLCLWNPVTLQSIDLPAIDFKLRWKDLILITTNPNLPDCSILIFLEHHIMIWDVNGDDKCWTSEDYPDDYSKEGYPRLFALVNDSKSIIIQTSLSMHYPLSIIELEKPITLVTKPKKWMKPYQPARMGGPNIVPKTYKVACRGEIFFIDVYYSGIWSISKEIVNIIVSKLRYVTSSSMTSSWHVVGTCPNAAFFISDDQVLYFPTSKIDEANRVYMVLENILYTYHIEKKIMSRSSLPNIPDCSTQPYWILGFPSNPPPLVKADSFASGFPVIRSFASTLQCEERENYHLPFDIWKDISSHLINPVDYLNFRATNKLFSSVGSVKDWRSISATSESISVSPFLIIPSLVDNSLSFMMEPVFSSTKYNLSTQWGYDLSTICSSSHGWLLMHTDCFPQMEIRLRLYNPMTKSTIRLPKVGYYDVFILTCSTDSSHCRVVALATMGIEPRFRYIDLNPKKANNEYMWSLGEIKKKGGVKYIRVSQSNINPACLEGKDYYYLLEDGELASYVYNRDDNSFTLSVLEGLPCRGSFEQRFIVAGYDDNIILIVHVGKKWQWLRVFEFDRSKMVKEWIEVEDLRGHNIYLSTMSCICKKAEVPVKGNRIYLTRFHGGRIVYYSLDTRKFHAGEGVSTVVASYYESEEQLHACWFEPSLA